jgi:hypothetical protein
MLNFFAMRLASHLSLILDRSSLSEVEADDLYEVSVLGLCAVLQTQAV